MVRGKRDVSTFLRNLCHFELITHVIIIIIIIKRLSSLHITSFLSGQHKWEFQESSMHQSTLSISTPMKVCLVLAVVLFPVRAWQSKFFPMERVSKRIGAKVNKQLPGPITQSCKNYFPFWEPGKRGRYCLRDESIVYNSLYTICNRSAALSFEKIH